MMRRILVVERDDVGRSVMATVVGNRLSLSS
jgi:hypothetical protein